MATPSATDFLPEQRSLDNLRSAVQDCQGCELYKRATQAVFGQGSSAAIMLVGEQPGNDEDIQGAPFVGPAGRCLDRALNEAGIDRDDVYVTNTVKHFSWEERGVRRLHKKPSAREIKACRPWLDAEIVAVNPQVIVCLGATAAQALLGKEFRITASRGQPVKWTNGQHALATWHPSAILRAPEADQRESMHKDLVTDLRRALSLCDRNKKQ